MKRKIMAAVAALGIMATVFVGGSTAQAAPQGGTPCNWAYAAGWGPMITGLKIVSVKYATPRIDGRGTNDFYEYRHYAANSTGGTTREIRGVSYAKCHN